MFRNKLLKKCSTNHTSEIWAHTQSLSFCSLFLHCRSCKRNNSVTSLQQQYIHFNLLMQGKFLKFVSLCRSTQVSHKNALFINYLQKHLLSHPSICAQKIAFMILLALWCAYSAYSWIHASITSFFSLFLHEISLLFLVNACVYVHQICGQGAILGCELITSRKKNHCQILKGLLISVHTLQKMMHRK